jgi:hypothetical protein
MPTVRGKLYAYTKKGKAKAAKARKAGSGARKAAKAMFSKRSG